MLGNEIKLLVEGEHSQGYEYLLDCSNLPSGFYSYRMQAGEFTATKKFILLH